MRIMKWSRCVSAAALLLALVAPGAASAATSTYQLHGDHATAAFSTVEPDGCTFTEVYIHVHESRYQIPPGGPQTGTWLDVQIVKTDECLGYQTLLNAFGSVEIPASAFDVQGNLLSATLDATVPVFEYISGESDVVTLSLSWAGEEDIFRNSQHERYASPYYKYTFRSSGSYRNAQATGTVIYRGVNLTPGPSAYAYLSSAQSGQVSIETF